MFKNIKDKLFDLIPGCIYRFYTDWIRWCSIKQKMKFWYQRKIRGWDDSETWSLDDKLYEWLLPRLKRFNDLNCCYPMDYKSFKSWKKEIDNRIKQLELIIKYKYCEWEFDDKMWTNQIKDTKNLDNINMKAYDKCLKNFNKWLANNINRLWW